MTHRLRLRPEARADVKKCYAWNEAREPGLGQRFKTELRALLDRIESGPETFPLHARRTRRAVLQRFHQVVFFVIEPDHVLVTGVFDGRRHPRSWSDRVREPARRFIVDATG
jgi:plasmid stabilization system protein ParE